MAKNAPQGDMNAKLTAKKLKKEAAKRNQKNKDDTSSSHSSEVSYSSVDLTVNDFIDYDNDFDEKANFDLLQKHFDKNYCYYKLNSRARLMLYIK